MGKIQRVTGKIFGETASAIDDPILGPEIGQFGSAKAGTYFGTTDIATIQDLPAWSNGWIDAVTPTDQFPPLPERTGVDKNFSQQICYLLQQGVPEWDAATDYHTNGYCSYDGYIYKSLVDNNINHTPDEEASIYWEKYGTSDEYANKDLSNLTNLGNSRLQYAPFSINNGRISLAGNNNTVTTLSGTEVAWTQPVMTSNGVLGGSSFAVEASSVYGSTFDAYMAMDGSSSTYWASENTPTLPIDYIIYSPNPIKITNIAVTTRNAGECATAGEVYGSTDGVSYVSVGAYTNSTTGAGSTYNIDLSSNTNFYNYYKIIITSMSTGSYICCNFALTATQQVSNGLTCYPCTITTCDGRTKVFDTATSLDTSTTADGDYWILKNYNDGTLSLIKQNILKISKSFALHGTVAGSITVDRNGVCSGFSTSNYIYTPTITLTGGATWKLTFEITTPSTISNQYFVGGYGLTNGYDAIAMGVVSGKFYVYLSNSTSSNLGTITGTSDVQPNTTYEGYIEFTGNAYNLYINGELEGTFASSTSIFASKWQFGGGHAGSGGALSSPWLGTINMNKVGLIRSGQNYWTGKEGYLDNSVFPYKLFVLPDDWTQPLENNNDLVCIGSCTLTSGAVTNLYNFAFDATKPGEWVQKATQLSTATTVGTRTISLANYLPKDIFNYELMMRYWITRQDTSNLDNYYYLSANNLRYLMTHVDGGNSNTDNQVTGGQCSLLEWGARAFIEEIQGTDNHALKTNSLYAIAYKRVGT